MGSNIAGGINLNITSTAISSINPSAMGWLITVGCFISIIVFSYLISKNFRYFINGAFVLIIGIIIFFISRGIGVEASQKNYIPFNYFLGIIIFIGVSIIIGHITKNIKLFKNIEKKIFGEKDE